MDRIQSRNPFDSPSPELMELMFESTSDGVLAIDADFRIRVVNRAMADILGIRRRDAVGRPCHEVLRTNICRDCCALKYTMETGRPIIDMAMDLHDTEGRRIPVALSCNLLRNEDGEVLGGVETFRNMNWVRSLADEEERRQPFAGIVTDDAHMRHIFDILPTIANSDSCVLVYGETGTGKNLLAKAVHNLSGRHQAPYVAVNCAALPESLLESELFGYRAGAFTGAVRDKPGRIAAAEGGTLFLDEIGDMPMSAQVKLLRFLQDHTYEPLGDVTPVVADVRVVAATNRDLARLVEEGVFRQDLYYRINVMNLELPPLRDRTADLPTLIRHFLERLSHKRRKHVAGITPQALAALERHDFPGNVRELENILEHAFVLCSGGTIDVDDLPKHLQTGTGRGRRDAPTTLPELEARFLRNALERNGWNRQETAKELGIHKATLLRRVARLGIVLPKTDGRTRNRNKRPRSG